LKTLERETGIEPATSSLGNCISIENTEFSVYGVYFRLYRTCSFTEPAKIDFLMEPKWSHSGLHTNAIQETLNPLKEIEHMFTWLPVSLPALGKSFPRTHCSSSRSCCDLFSAHYALIPLVKCRAFSLIQLLILSAHLLASPFSLLLVDWSAAERAFTCESPSALRDTLPFALEEKVRVTVALRANIVTQELPTPRILGWLLRLPETCLGLRGFEPRVFERPPPLKR